jgi:hypothetical protein
VKRGALLDGGGFVVYHGILRVEEATRVPGGPLALFGMQILRPIILFANIDVSIIKMCLDI